MLHFLLSGFGSRALRNLRLTTLDQPVAMSREKLVHHDEHCRTLYPEREGN
jgi:hypothetical protein